MTIIRGPEIRISEVRPEFVARIEDVDLPARLDEPTFLQLRALLGRYPVIILPHAVPLTASEQVEFAARFGPVMTAHRKWEVIEPMRGSVLGALEISNLDAGGNPVGADHRRTRLLASDRQWHSDNSFHPNRAVYSFLSAEEIPPAGGYTEFADMRSAFDSLSPAERERLSKFSVLHSLAHSRQAAGLPDDIDGPLPGASEASHWLVQFNGSGRRGALYLGAHAARIEQLSLEEGSGLIASLMDMATDPHRVYTHRWTRGDLVIWDNLSTMHRATEYEADSYRREMRRTVVRDWDDSLPRSVIDRLAAERNRRPPHVVRE